MSSSMSVDLFPSFGGPAVDGAVDGAGHTPSVAWRFPLLEALDQPPNATSPSSSNFLFRHSFGAGKLLEGLVAAR